MCAASHDDAPPTHAGSSAPLIDAHNTSLSTILGTRQPAGPVSFRECVRMGVPRPSLLCPLSHVCVQVCGALGAGGGGGAAAGAPRGELSVGVCGCERCTTGSGCRATLSAIEQQQQWAAHCKGRTDDPSCSPVCSLSAALAHRARPRAGTRRAGWPPKRLCSARSPTGGRCSSSCGSSRYDWEAQTRAVVLAEVSVQRRAWCACASAWV